MDEIDSIGSTRLEGGSGGDSEVQRTMLELLNQLDGFEPKQNIKVRRLAFVRLLPWQWTMDPHVTSTAGAAAAVDWCLFNIYCLRLDIGRPRTSDVALKWRTDVLIPAS